jgi:hypothetical protein
MSKIKLFFTLSFFTLLSSIVAAQSVQTKDSSDFIVGKWNILVKATPQGDVKTIFVIQKSDSILTGVLQDTTGKETSKIDKVEVSGATITIYFKAMGYDLNMIMNKKDEDHITGLLLNMFEAEGERVKEIK